MDQDLKKYELAFLLVKDTDLEEVRKTLLRGQASITLETNLARTKISYPIKKESFGYFGQIFFAVKPELIKEIDQSFRTLHAVLRFLILEVSGVKAGQPGYRIRGGGQRKEREAGLRERFGAVEEEEKRVPIAMPIAYERMEERRPREETFRGELSNEALEKKLEEILKE